MVMLTVKTIYYNNNNKFILQVDMCPNYFFRSELVQFIICCDGPCYDHQKNYQTVSEMSGNIQDFSFEKLQKLFLSFFLKKKKKKILYIYSTLSDVLCFLFLMRFQLLSFQQVPVSLAAIINVHVPYMYPPRILF